MKFLTSLLILFVLMSGTSCRKITDSIDITQSDWTLDCIAVGRDKKKVRCKDCKRSLAYILRFDDEEMFHLDTSVNSAMGHYSLPENGTFIITSYGEITAVGGGNEMDQLILEKMKTVTSYDAYSNKIVLHGDDCELTFLKR
jgi:hypothetical protein